MASAEKVIAGGVIGGVDASNKIIRVSLSGEEVSNKGVKMPSGEVIKLVVNADTTITVNRLYRTFADLAPGQKLTKFYYIDENGRTLATIIHVTDEALLERQRQKAPTAPGGEAEQAKPAI